MVCPSAAGNAPDDTCRAAVAYGPPKRGERLVGVIGEQHGGRAARERVVAEVGSAANGDEKVALVDPSRVDLDAGDLVAIGEVAEDLPRRPLARGGLVAERGLGRTRHELLDFAERGAQHLDRVVTAQRAQ